MLEGSESPVVPISADAHQFLVGQDAQGHWLAVETHGLGGGIFITRDAALHYALSETGKRPGAVSFAPLPITLG
ncbi:hypothetical protein [Beijerinckia sp. L45]|uniref:hypothetical protein n=1 Tax=Beijerinckia sp. L45 TaxID=1641855 RepID=UPI00131D85FF|nr:hypothetical protein [Beijerinckia sp. L45]